MVKRGRLEILKDTLKIIQENHNIKPTILLRKSKMSSMRFKEYYLDILSRGFIKENVHNGGKTISLTEKGFRFLERYKSIIEFIGEFDL